eukprot:scaffold1247_cov251-Pinguiococcus_pyrenoidosus.AAC.5
MGQGKRGRLGHRLRHGRHRLGQVFQTPLLSGQDAGQQLVVGVRLLLQLGRRIAVVAEEIEHHLCIFQEALARLLCSPSQALRLQDALLEELGVATCRAVSHAELDRGRLAAVDVLPKLPVLRLQVADFHLGRHQHASQSVDGLLHLSLRLFLELLLQRLRGSLRAHGFRRLDAAEGVLQLILQLAQAALEIRIVHSEVRDLLRGVVEAAERLIQLVLEDGRGGARVLLRRGASGATCTLERHSAARRRLDLDAIPALHSGASHPARGGRACERPRDGGRYRWDGLVAARIGIGRLDGDLEREKLRHEHSRAHCRVA